MLMLNHLEIANLPLKRQCEHLSLPLEIATLPKGVRPELGIMASMARDDSRAAFCEGGAVKLLLNCLAFELLYSVNKKSVEPYSTIWTRKAAIQRQMYFIRFSLDPRIDSRLLEIEPRLASKLVDEVARSTERKLIKAYGTLEKWQCKPPGFSDRISRGCWRMQKWKGVDRNFVVSLYRALGPARCAEVAREILDAESWEYSSGWPDLVCVGTENVELVEVKTTDTLHSGQIQAFPKIRDCLGFPIRVVQVRRSTPSC